MDSQIQGVYMTNDLSKFHLIANNRPIGSFSRIESNVKEYGWQIQDFPISVDASFGVLAGQHRLLYAKKHGLPIAYRFSSMAMQDYQQVEKAGRRWSTKEFVKSFADGGSEPHRRLLDFLTENPEVKETLYSSILLGRGEGYVPGGKKTCTLSSLWQGLKLPDIDYAEAKKRVEEIQQLNSVYRGQQRGGLMTNAVKSYCYVRKAPTYSFNRMLKQFAKYQDDFAFDGTQGNCTKNFDAVYNKRTTPKVPLLYAK
jgi:hypothetical protein